MQTRAEERSEDRRLPSVRQWSTSARPGGSGPSRSRRGSSSRRWRASACRRFAARADASARASCARRWSAAPGSSTATSARSATSGSPPTSTRSRSSSSAPSRRRWPRRRGWSRRPAPTSSTSTSAVPCARSRRPAPGATLLDDPDRAARIVSAIADAVDIPVTVKLRRGLRDGSRDCLVVGPAARRGRRGVADAPSPLRAADVHGHRRPRASPPSSSRSSTCR